MAISKERLEQLIQQCANAYMPDTKFKTITEIPIRLVIFPDHCYETKAEAQWHADNDAKRAEHFCPPMELKNNETWYFNTPKGYGWISASVWQYTVHVMQIFSETIDRHFNIYEEAVEYARKRFKGEL